MLVLSILLNVFLGAMVWKGAVGNEAGVGVEVHSQQELALTDTAALGTIVIMKGYVDELPGGWLPLDGREVEAARYPDLAEMLRIWDEARRGDAASPSPESPSLPDLRMLTGPASPAQWADNEHINMSSWDRWWLSRLGGTETVLGSLAVPFSQGGALMLGFGMTDLVTFAIRAE